MKELFLTCRVRRGNCSIYLLRSEIRMFRHIIKFDFLPFNTDVGMLTLRMIVGLSLFIKHGWEKIFTFSSMVPTFSDPLHLGHTTSLIFALISDGICSLLIVFGFATRWACMYCFCTIFVAWSLRHHFMFLGAHGTGDHGELIVLYLAALIAIFIVGPGRYSIDRSLNG